jgi:hypothetical protein
MIASKGNATARCRELVILSGREGPAAYAGREVARRSGRARFGDATVRGIARRACCAPHAVPLTRHQMVEVILTEAQLACLKAAVTIGSEESAALGRGVGLGSKLFSPEPFAIRCPREIATRLLAVAERFCSDAVPEIRAAIDQEKQ